MIEDPDYLRKLVVCLMIGLVVTQISLIVHLIGHIV